ncbi:MAG TPA: AAA family ATPase [Pseudonocardiaceae bacterium]
MVERRGLDTIEIEGFLSIRSASVSLRRLNVLVGANGAGKSNLVRVFEFLGRLVDQDLGLFVGLNGGASALLNDGAEPHIRIAVDGLPNKYQALFLPTAKDELIFEWEHVYSEGEGPEKYINISLGGGYRETRLSDDAQSHPGGAASYVVDLLRGCRVFHFHDTSLNSPVKRASPTADNISLHGDASNLASVLLHLKDSDGRADRVAYRRITGIIRLVAPFFRDFVLVPEPGDRIRLRWRQEGSDTVFSAHQMSDGTLRFACLATLLLHPDLPAVVVLDEPELGLHPYAIVQLAGLLRQAAHRSQVVFATQSVTLMNQFEVDDLIVVERHDGASTFHRPDSETLTGWLEEYSLGELWEKNLIGGRPSGNAE